MGRKFKFAETELQYSGAVVGSKFLFIDILPEQENSLTYNAKVQYPTFRNLDPIQLLVEGEKFATDAGTHYITVTPIGNFAWRDGTQRPIQIPWVIDRQKLTAIPVQKGSLTFNNAEQTPEWENYDPAQLDIGGIYQNQIDAGTYPATFTPNHNYAWPDGTFGAIEAPWSIAILKLAKPTAATRSLTFNNNTQSLTVSNFISTYMTVSGTTSARNVGNYAATYSLKSTANTHWSDDSTTAVEISWQINILYLAKVTATSSSLTFNNANQEPNFANFNSTYIKKTGSTYKNVGDYSTTFELRDNVNTKWTGGSVDAIAIAWHIIKLTLAKVTLSSSTLPYNGNAQEPTFTNYNATYMNKSGESHTDVGSYSTSFSLKDTNNTQWQGGTITDVTLSWQIGKAQVAIPTQSGSLTYDGYSQSPNWNNFDYTMMTVTGDTATNAGTYTATFRITDNNYNFTNNSQTATATWTIGKKTVKAPTFPNSKYDYSIDYPGYAIKIMDYIENFDTDTMKTDSKYKDCYDGTYYCHITPTSNCQWQNGSSDSITYTLTVNAVAYDGMYGYTYSGGTSGTSNFHRTNITVEDNRPLDNRFVILGYCYCEHATDWKVKKSELTTLNARACTATIYSKSYPAYFVAIENFFVIGSPAAGTTHTETVEVTAKIPGYKDLVFTLTATIHWIE